MKRFTVNASMALTLGLGLILTLLWTLSHLGAELPVVRAADLHVCPSGCTYSSVQDAVDAANPGDVIKVAEGNYTGVQMHGGQWQIVHLGKTVTIRGGYSSDFAVWDPNTHPTTLDAEGAGRVVYITGNVTPTLEGLRLTNGLAIGDHGGGVYVSDAHPAINGCQVYNNSADQNGGGISLHGATGTELADNQFYSNAAGWSGGGVSLSGGSDGVVLTGNQVYDNAASSGGGFSIDSSDNVDLLGNYVYSNTARTIDGGGINIYKSDNAALMGNRVYSNTADILGGGIYLDSSANPTLAGNQIYSNTADSDGGGIYLIESDASLEGDIIRWNTSENGVGSGVAMFYSAPVSTNTVVADNVGNSSLLRAAIYVRGSSPHFSHLTLARHVYDGLYVSHQDTTYSTVYLTNTIIYSHTWGVVVYWSGNHVYLQSTLFHNTTNPVNGLSGGVISEADRRTGDPAFLTDGYHIGSGSAALDRVGCAGVTTDVDGDPRPAGPSCDIGADELWPKVYLPLVLRQVP
jgi:parallel beta-helix repeat protein